MYLIGWDYLISRFQMAFFITIFVCLSKAELNNFKFNVNVNIN